MRPYFSRRGATRVRSTLGWGVLFYALVQSIFWLGPIQKPIHRDDCFKPKLECLQDQLTAEPGRPIVLLQGTSRVLFGIRPDRLAQRQPRSGCAPIVFNFSQLASGPLYHLLTVKRLLSRGIRPELVFLEVWPAHQLREQAYQRDLERVCRRPLEWADLEVLRRYSVQPSGYGVQWLTEWLAPAFAFRLYLGQAWLPRWFETIPQLSRVEVDALGWYAADPVPDLAYKKYLVQEFYRPRIEPEFQSWQCTPFEDAALREILAVYQSQSVRVILLFLPEGKELQSWYRPEVWAAVTGYLNRLSWEFRVPWIDTRDWAPESAFVDDIHLDRQGATQFTERLDREVLQPLLENPMARPRISRVFETH